MITLLFLFFFGFIIWLSAQAALRHDAREELLACAALQKKAEEALAHADVRDDARHAFVHARAAYTRVKWLPERDYSWLFGNLFALREAASAHAEFQETMRMAADDVAIALHVRNTLTAVSMQLKLVSRAFSGCNVKDADANALIAAANEHLSSKDYAQAEEKAMAAFRLICEWTDHLIEYRKRCRGKQTAHCGQCQPAAGDEMFTSGQLPPEELSGLPAWAQDVRRQERERPGD